MRQELIAQPGTLARTFDDASDVDEGHSRRKNLLRPKDLGQRV